MREIYIFDIDGCVIPPIFSNFIDENAPRERVVKFVEENGYKFELFPAFITFYKKNCKAAESVIFLTGRKKSEFGKLTESQLSSLTEIKSFRIIYYPEEKQNIAREYFKWKPKQIQKILKGIIGDHHFNKESRELLAIKVFDDLTKYYPKVEKIAKKLKLDIQLFKIEGKESWVSLLE